jgi:transcriptional regulator with XRE-family HTH domain
MQSLSLEVSMGIDLKNLTAKQALSLAKSLSGKTNEDIAEALGQDHSTVKRYFNENDRDYYPSLMRLPGVCLALGNTVLLDWIQKQVEEDGGPAEGISSDRDLLRQANSLALEIGGVHRIVDDIIRRSSLEDPERLLAELFAVERKCRAFRRELQEAGGSNLESEGWEFAVARGES